MWLLDKFLKKLITKGELIVIDHDGTTRRYGSPDPTARAGHRSPDRFAHRR